MDKEEIKAAYSMRDVLSRYGISANRSGFIQCPFHKGDNTPSMKVYKDSYHCFACGCSGDIFTFIQEMDHVSFKEAFYSLGGEYKKPTFQSKLALYKLSKKKIEREKLEVRDHNIKELNNMLISICRNVINRAEPLSDPWCSAINMLQMQLEKHRELNS